MQYLHVIVLGTETEPGVIPRSVENVFVFIKKASPSAHRQMTTYS